MAVSFSWSLLIAFILAVTCANTVSDHVLTGHSTTWIHKLLFGCLSAFLLLLTVLVLDFNSKWPVSVYHTYWSMIQQYVLSTTCVLMAKIYYGRLEHDSKNIRCAQDEYLLQQIRNNEKTEYGKKYNFASIKNRKDFVRLHPLTEYSDYEPYIERMAKGEVNVLLPDRPRMLGVTSGTSTGKSKIIPLSTLYVSQMFYKVILPVFNIIRQHFPQSFGLQKQLRFSYTPRWRFSEANIPIGPASAPNSKNVDRLQINYTTPKAATSIKTEPEALYIHLLFGLRDPYIEKIEANFASMIYFAFVSLENNWRDLVEDIRLGRVNPDLNIRQDVRDKLDKLLKPDPIRAAHLDHEFRKGFVGIAKRLWHHCTYIICCTSGAFSIYASALEEKYAKDIRMFSPIYSSTEGPIGINLWPQEELAHYVMTCNTTFFEFIPISLVDESEPKTLFLDQIKEGETYEVVITNMSGLYRYRFGDIVRVTRFWNECPVVEFLSRKGQLLNVRGEKIGEDAFYYALVHCANRWHHRRVMDYTCCESVLMDTLQGKTTSSVPYYLVFVELSGGDGDQVPVITGAEKHMLDDTLRKMSYVYESFRAKGSIDPIAVSVVRSGTFAQFRAFILENTQAASNQVKIPRVMMRKEYLQFMLDRTVS